MNYIYDVLLNFNDDLYEFYDWNKNDVITHVRKMPIIKIESIDLEKIKNNYVKFDMEFLLSIKNKCEVFNNKNIKYLEYAFILTDSNDAIAINIKDDNVKSSRLLVEEEMEVLDNSLRYDIVNIKYDIINKKKINNFKTRKELEIEKYLKKEINNLKTADIEKLKYIYYDCFDEIENDRDKIINKINLELNKNFNILSKKLYTFFKLVHK